MNFERNNFAILAADRYVDYAGLCYSRVFEVLLAVKANLVVNNDDVLCFEPFPDIFLTLTALANAHLKAHHELLSHR